MKKGEVMFLLAKSNKDWWNVRTVAGKDGFVPSNYVKEIEPKTVQVEVTRDDEHFKTGRDDLTPAALDQRLQALVGLYQVKLVGTKHVSFYIRNTYKAQAFFGRFYGG